MLLFPDKTMPKIHPGDARAPEKRAPKKTEERVTFKKDEDPYPYDFFFAALVLSDLPFRKAEVRFDEASFSENHRKCSDCGYETNSIRKMRCHTCLTDEQQ